ncbi:hypothetical protein TEA_001141 [Camellia sinensis var. sinensis]|uniref:Cupin type-1 domain-containing protein n=1 Tax=Camellia sinensis var. sinensis TaxID=542762 RepID=A0A4S4DAZ3_CAMSN|nr:hypothetical protein TEA_001141 [Camellia sinensis var. sinensis]
MGSCGSKRLKCRPASVNYTKQKDKIEKRKSKRLLAITCSVASAFDNSPLQDFCVADNSSSVLVNGLVCKDPKLVQANDFLFRGLHLPGNTSNAVGSKRNVGHGNAIAISALSSQNPGIITIANAVFGSKPAISSDLLSKAFQRNVGHGNAIAISALSSQNPGIITIANAVFGSKPAISSDLLSKAFQVDKNIIVRMESQF